MTYNVFGGTLKLAQSINPVCHQSKYKNMQLYRRADSRQLLLLPNANLCCFIVLIQLLAARF